MGTLPMWMIALPKIFKYFSAIAKKNIPVPTVSITNCKEGGYFVTLSQDKIVNTMDFCVTHGRGSP